MRARVAILMLTLHTLLVNYGDGLLCILVLLCDIDTDALTFAIHYALPRCILCGIFMSAMVFDFLREDDFSIDLSHYGPPPLPDIPDDIVFLDVPPWESTVSLKTREECGTFWIRF